MAGTPQGRRLTEGHRAAQVAIRTRLSADTLAAWSMLDMRALDDSTPGWLAVMLALIGAYRQESAETAAAYVTGYRAAELSGTPATDARTPDLARHAAPDRARATASLIVTGPATVKAATKRGKALADASRAARSRVTGAVTRHALAGGRAVIRDAVSKDLQAVGWIRVTDGDPCWFCAMLAGRGPVYRSQRSATFGDDGDQYHDGCACQVEPVYDRRAPWPGRGAEFARLWRKTTRGLSGNDARAAFRKAIQDMTAGQDRTVRSAPGDDDRPGRTPAALSAAQVLTGLSDEDLAERFADASAADKVDEAELDRLLAEMDRRDAPAADPDPLAGLDLSALPTHSLFDLWRDHEPYASIAERIGAELDRRASGTRATDPDPDSAADTSPGAAETLAELGEALAKRAAQSEREAHIDALIARGYDYIEAYAQVYGLDDAQLRRQELAAAVDTQRRAGETRDQTARRLYDEWVHLQWIAAEAATNGYLLSAAARAAGVDARSLWGGNVTRARKYASEELKRWWENNPRQTFGEFRAVLLGRDRDIQAARRNAGRGNDKDFGL